MGSQLHLRIQGIKSSIITMKFFVLASLLALAAAESDPQIFRQAHGFAPTAYHGMGYNFITPASTQLLQPQYNQYQSMAYQFPMTYQNTFDMFNQRFFGTQGVRHFAKRDAEAEAEADPYVFYTTPGYSRRVYNTPAYAQQYQYGQQFQYNPMTYTQQQVAPVVYNQPMVQTPVVYNQPRYHAQMVYAQQPRIQDQMVYAQQPQAVAYQYERMSNAH